MILTPGKLHGIKILELEPTVENYLGNSSITYKSY